MDITNPNVVQQLRPKNSSGLSTLTYELNSASVSPTRIVGRDARGFPLEETVPTVHWRPFLTTDGCIHKVPLRTGSVPSMHGDAVAYENETTPELVASGWIPAWLCPYSTMFSHITRGPFARSENGEEDCGGSEREGGCSHLKHVAKLRQDYVTAEYKQRVASFSAEHQVEFERMRDGIVEGVGAAVAKYMTPQASVEQARQKLRKGEAGE